MVGKNVQFPGGPREQEDAVIGLPRQVRVDEDSNQLRVHDGQTPGGHALATVDYVEQVLRTGGAESTVGVVQIFSTIVELAESTPASNLLAVVRENTKEDVFVWQSGAGDSGDVTSTVAGHWKRLDGPSGFAIRLWRAGIINLQINGTAPASNQNITAWLTGDVIKLWDSSAYVNATPALWMRLFAQVGGYTTGSLVLPNRLAEQLTETTNLDTVTLSGWYRTSSGATGNPTPGVHAVEHREISALVAVQRVYPAADTYAGHWIRYRSSNSPVTWSSWSYVYGTFPERLRSSQATIADANSATESGFYRLQASAANAPSTAVASLIVVRLDGNNLAQFVISDGGAIYSRTRVAAAWGSWINFSASTHTHDDRYYTESEVDSLLAGKAAASHTHDDRYYTESEVNSLLAAKAALVPALYAVGSYVVGYYNLGPISVGSTISGSNLQVAGIDSNQQLTGAIVGVGTWRHLGAIPNSGSSVYWSLWLRIS